MANTTDIRACKHEDDRFKEQIDMNKKNLGDIRGLTRVAVIGIVLALSSAQGVVADSLRPTVDTGGSGAGASAQEYREAAAAAESGTYYVIIDEQGNAIVPEQVHLGLFEQAGASSGAISADVSPVQEQREAAAAAESMLVSAGTYYVIIDEQGNAIVPEQVHLGLFAQAGSSSPQQRVATCPPCAIEA